MADDQRRLLGSVEQPTDRRRVSVRRSIQALTAREALGWSVLLLPGPVSGDRLPVEFAGVDFVEIGVDSDGDAPIAESQFQRLPRAQEPAADSLIDLEVGELLPEKPGLLPPVACQADAVRGVAAHEVGRVRSGLAVADEDEDAHRSGRFRLQLARADPSFQRVQGAREPVDPIALQLVCQPLEVEPGYGEIAEGEGRPFDIPGERVGDLPMGFERFQRRLA
jgi:hypothetical protein